MRAIVLLLSIILTAAFAMPISAEEATGSVGSNGNQRTVVDGTQEVTMVEFTVNIGGDASNTVTVWAPKGTNLEETLRGATKDARTHWKVTYKKDQKYKSPKTGKPVKLNLAQKAQIA